MRESKVDRDILVDLLVYGDDKAENIGRRADRPPSSVSRSLSDLRKDEYVKEKGGGVYELSERGREEARALLRMGYNPYHES